MPILAIDIGNTTTTLAMVNGRKVSGRQEISTTLAPRTYQSALEAVIRQAVTACDVVVITSVVPQALRRVEAVLRKIIRDGSRKGTVPFRGQVYVVGRDLRVPLKNRYTHPERVGQDRLVSAYAAARLYGAPAIIVDLGTAITFDVVSAKGEYLGGIITPGIRLSTEALYQKTALLPRARIQKPRRLIGRDTEGSIMSGIFYGYGEMIRRLIRRISRDVTGRPKVIVTGGFTRLMKSYIAGQVHQVDKDLVLKGMGVLFEGARSKE